MAKHIGDLLERAAGVEKPTGQRVAKNVHPGVRQPGATIRLAHGTPDDVGGHWFIYGRHVPNEDPAAHGLWAFRAHVVGNGSAGGGLVHL